MITQSTTTTDVHFFERVSTGSQDESTQHKTLVKFAADHKMNMISKTVLHGYRASTGEQEPALRAAIEGIEQHLYSVILVTDSSRLDRREDLDAQAEILLAIRQAGGDVISTTEPNFGKTDFVGRLVTLVAQYANAEKSKTVKDGTWRGVQAIIDNRSWYGVLPTFWKASGERFCKQAVCTDPEAVRAIYIAIRDGHSLSSVAREHNTYPKSIRTLVRTRANTTGVFDCKYTYKGETYRWQHPVEPVVDTELWHAANRVMTDTGAIKNNLGGRPVQLAKSWVSGLIPCPGCGGRLYVSRGKTLQCGGRGKDRRSCGVSGIGLAGIAEQIEEIISSPNVLVYRYQRVVGNEGELAELQAELERVRQTLATTDDDTEFDRLADHRRALRRMIERFELVRDSYAMTATGETLADLWQTGDKRQIMKAVQRHITFSVTPEGHVSIVGVYPNENLIELDEATCIRVAAIGRQTRRLAQYAAA